VPSPQNREDELFALALEMPAAKRPALLDAMCAGDPALRQRLETLLAAHQMVDESTLSVAPAIVATIKLDLAEAEDEAVGKTIGRYKVLEKVGEGGCGVVYVAEQTEPVRRRVALKVIKLGMDTKQVVARFEAERQALAMMDHPNIAKVLDAGATENGRPYFVMELVRGIKITEYCDQAKLSTLDRLNLFIKVCQAIQHAHQKGIIHRDIKPSNILVTLHDGVPVPKVIDFGIAKATEGRLTDATVYTQLHQFIGTPAYMSPEQAEMSGLDIDTRSDIYSLGVLLYELLAGSTPFDAKELMASGIDAMRKTIREQEPVRPSTRLATLKGEELTTAAQRRSLEAPKLIHLLKGDLDWIVMKCLEKDRTRRYETANGLAFDLKRYLDNEAVLARPPSTLYRFQKLLRRSRRPIMAAGAVTALAMALLLTIWSFRKEHAAKMALEKVAAARLAEKAAAKIVLQPAPWVDGEEMQFDSKPAGATAGNIRFAVRSAQTNGQGIWRMIVDFAGASRILVEAQADTLAPIHSHYRIGESFKDVYYESDHAEVKSLGEAEVTKIPLDGPMFDNCEFFELVRRLPLKPGYKIGLPLFTPGNPVSIRWGLEVGGLEDVTVPAGTFQCFKLKPFGGQTYWYSTDLHHYLVKFETKGAVFELAAVRNPTLAESIEDLIQQRTVEAVDEAQELAAGNAQFLPRVSQARQVVALETQGGSLSKEGKFAQAESKYREALATSRKYWPADPHQWESDVEKLTGILAQEGKFDQAEEVFNETLTLDIRNQSLSTNLLEQRASFLARRCHWKEAAADYLKLIEFLPDNHFLYHSLGPLLVQSGDRDGYRRHCASIVAHFAGTNDPVVAERMAKECLILPDAGVDLSVVTALADTAVTKGQDMPGLLPWFKFTKSLAEYRAGHYASSAEWAQQVLPKAENNPNLESAARMVLAMAQYQLHQTEDSRSNLGAGMEVIERSVPRLDTGDNGGSPTDPIIARALMKEARDLIQ